MTKNNSLNKKFNSFIKSPLLLLFFLSFISCEIIWVDYDTSQKFGIKEVNNAEKTQIFTLDLNNTMDKAIDPYMKVTVTPNENIETPILCFSPSDAGCLKNRQVISRVTNGKSAILLLKKEQFFYESDELNVLVTCVENKCSYTITFEGCQSAEIDTQTSYSYLVTKANREMRFEVIGEISEEGVSLIIGIEGSITAQIDIEGVDKIPYEFKSGKIINYQINNENNSTLLSRFYIKGASEGDYITLNVHTITNNLKAPDNLLYPNGPVVMGMLDSEEGITEECFPISSLSSEKYKNVNKYYLTMTIYSKYALFWLADESGMYMEETEKEISDGIFSYVIENEGKMRYVCFEFSYEDWVINQEYVVYSLSILEPTRLESTYDFYPPQIINQIYPRMIPKGKIAVFNGGQMSQSDKRISFNVYNRKGVAELYVKECRDFPFCLYKPEELDEKDRVKNLNKMSIKEITINTDYNALEKEKNVMIVYCKDDDNENKGYCEIESLILTQRKEITLIENEDFSKYVLKNDQGTFKLDFQKKVKIKRISIDIMVYSGDVTFTVKSLKSNDGKLKDEEIDLNHYKYFLSNKVYFHYIFDDVELSEMTIEYKAVLNSFFSIKYDMDYSNLVQNEENVRSGKSYLVEIDPTSSDKSKTIYLENYRYKKEKPFLANFFALNCEFQVTREENEISFFDGYAQEILLSNSLKYKSEKYEYKIKVMEADLSNYNHKMCMLYVAGYETKDEDFSTEIVVSENINQQIIFDDNFKNVRFLYPHSDPGKDLAIYVNIIDPAYYRIVVSFNNEEEPTYIYTVTRSQIFYISSNEIINHCQTDTLCNVIINATLAGPLSSMPKTEPMIEITIRQIKNNPSYLQKSHAKKDFTCGDNFYYLYTEIGKNEVGEITVNFLRDFGYVYAKVVRKDLIYGEDEPNWRGIYRMPSKDWGDSLPYNDYTKKIIVDTQNTQDCIEGCYLLISIQISQIGEYVEDSKFYPFSIIARVNPNSQVYVDIPKVVIQANEYIVGNIDLSKNERISQFYEVWLPHDSSEVNFDWQSKVAGLYINLGGIRPTTKNADFILLPPGRDSVLTLSKDDILKKANEKKIKVPNENSLEDLNLVIGVWTDKTDSIDTEIYSLRVHQPLDDLDIIELNTDQKIICIPKYLDNNQYRCLFMVTYDDEDERLQMPLFVHASSVNQSAITNTYASFIERKYYDELELETLRSKIPTFETAQFSTFKSGFDYIYTTLVPGREKNYFFVNVISDKPDNIMIITSLPVYNVINPDNYEFYPNPTSEQLLSVSVEKLKLRFFTTSSLIVNIVTLSGEAELIWEKDPNVVYNLRGKGDRLSLTSGTKLNEIIITKRSEQKLSEDGDPGFVFYVSYLMRDEENNFDEIQYGQSLEIAYRETHLPVHLYSKIGSTFNDLNIAVTFRDSDIDLEGEYIFSPLIVRAALTKENTIYKAKQSSELSPSFGKTVFGIYDPAIKTAQVFLDVNTISSFNIKPKDNPTLYLSIEESKSIPSQKYSKFSIEAQFNIINSEIIPAEKTFNYGRFSNKIFNFYKLKINKSKSFMVIEIAFNSELLEYSINDQLLTTNNTELIVKSQKERGKSLITVKNPQNKEFVYLMFFLKKKGQNENDYNLYNYVFKYINVEYEDEFTDFKILENNELQYEEKADENDKSKYVIKCTFNKINIDKDKANITYFFKVVENSTLIYGESVETIAIMQSEYYTVYKRNPEDNNGKITLIAQGDLSNWAYLQVIAQIQQDTILDYVSYKGVVNIRPYKGGKGSSDKGSNTILFSVVMIVLIGIVVILAIAVLVIQKSNKSLINQVKHISFQQQNAGASSNADPNLLLNKDQ